MSVKTLSRKTASSVLIIIGGLALLPVPFMLFALGMGLFDNPPVYVPFGPKLLFFLWLAYPVVYVVSLVGVIEKFRKDDRAALIVSTFPILNLALIFLVWEFLVGK